MMLNISKMKSLKSRKLLIVLAVLFLCSTMFLIYSKLLKPPKLFRRYVLNPIPESVTNIKADQVGAFRGYQFVFRFDINRADLDLIIKSRPFREAKITDYLGGGGLYLVFRVGSFYPEGQSFGIYGAKRHKPSWYTLESWEKPETYALVKEEKVKGEDTIDIQVLIYNTKLEQAFFIIYYCWGK